MKASVITEPRGPETLIYGDRPDRIRGHHQAPRPGETEEQRKARDGREFAALQASPFFDLWASAGIDETLSALHENLVVGDG